jgi:hypothetical protein
VLVESPLVVVKSPCRFDVGASARTAPTYAEVAVVHLRANVEIAQRQMPPEGGSLDRAFPHNLEPMRLD